MYPTNLKWEEFTMQGDETPLPKPEPQNPDETSNNEDFAVEDEDEDEETEQEGEERARAELGEVCANCGDEFTESNGKPALCADCFATAEDVGEKHDPLSKYPVAAA